MQCKAIVTRFLILSSLFLAALMPAPLLAQTTPPAAQQTTGQPAAANDFSGLRETGMDIVTGVIDPLTITLKKGDIIHLTGLDYPDLDYYTPGRFSQLAIKVLRDMLVGKTVKIYQTQNPEIGRQNRMGQRIAHLKLKDNDLWVQGTILRLGLARMRTTTSNSQMAEQMRALESQARKEKLGIWGLVAYQIHNVDDAHFYIGSYQIIEGTIHNIGMKNNRVYFNFGDNWRTDFTASIGPLNKRDFRNAGYDFQNMSGQKVRVRGWVSAYNGPYIELTHPSQLEVLGTDTTTPEHPTETKENESAIPQKNDALPDPEQDANKDAIRKTKILSTKKDLEKTLILNQ